jgi:hypothetical protein
MLYPVPKPPKRVKVRKPLRARRVPKAFAKHRVPTFHKWVATFECLLIAKHICGGRVEACHVRSRGAGGDDVGNEIPLCKLAHQQWHLWGRLTWQKRYDVDAQVAAALLGRKYLKEVAPCP